MSKKLTSVLIGMFSFVTSCNTSIQTDEIVRITAEGTPEELRNEIEAEKISDISSIRFGRDYALTHIAIGNELHPQVINVLYEFGGDINAQDTDLRTPLDYAVDNDNPRAARILLELGADPLRENGSGFNVLNACKNVVLRDFPNHRTCNVILNFLDEK